MLRRPAVSALGSCPTPAVIITTIATVIALAALIAGTELNRQDLFDDFIDVALAEERNLATNTSLGDLVMKWSQSLWFYKVSGILRCSEGKLVQQSNVARGDGSHVTVRDHQLIGTVGATLWSAQVRYNCSSKKGALNLEDTVTIHLEDVKLLLEVGLKLIGKGASSGGYGRCQVASLSANIQGVGARSLDAPSRNFLAWLKDTVHEKIIERTTKQLNRSLNPLFRKIARDVLKRDAYASLCLDLGE